VVTLGYLVVQIRQNNKMLSSSVYGSWVVTANQTLELLAVHAEPLAAMYEGTRSFNSLTPVEQRIHTAYFVGVMNVYEAAYFNYLDGAIQQTMHDAKCRNLVRLFRTTPLLRESWSRGSSELFDDRFVDYVEHEVFSKIEATA